MESALPGTADVVAMVEQGCVGSLTNLVEVTTEEGARGTDDVTAKAGRHVYLPLVLRNGSLRRTSAGLPDGTVHE